MNRAALLFALFLLSAVPANAATRLYVSNGVTGAMPTVKGTWTDSSSTTTGILATKGGVAATVGISNSNTNVNVMNMRFVSLPFDGSYSFATTDTVQWMVGAVASSTSNSAWTFRVHIFVIQDDNVTVRGTLVSNSTGATTFTTSAAGRSDTVNLSNNVTVQKGDRIVMELGYSRTGSNSTSRSATFNYGNMGTTDLSSGSASVTTQPGWIEFSNNFTTARPNGGIAFFRD